MRKAYYFRGTDETPATAGGSASGPRRGMAKRVLEALFGTAKAALKATFGMDLIVVVDHAELEAHPQAQDIVGDPGYDRSVQAAISPDRTRVFFVASAIRSPARAKQLFLHELVGHFSMEKMLGQRLFQELRDAIIRLRDNGKWPEVFAEVSKR